MGHHTRVPRNVALKLARSQDALGQAVSDLVLNNGWRLSRHYRPSRYVKRMMNPFAVVATRR
jgi:hypothetical protein